VEYGVAYRALFISGLAAVCSVFILYLILQNWKKAGILTVLWLLAFFFYGHVFGYVKGLEINGRVIGRHTYFMAVWLILFFVIVWLTLKGSWQAALVPALGTMSIVLVIFPLYQLARYQYGVSKKTQILPPEISVPVQPMETSPDIYFIILDMYGRNDVLREEFGYDDGPFLRQLKDMGFYVASCSQSNYHSTAYSLSATLDANYLNALSDQFTPANKEPSHVAPIQNSAVETVLREHGYRLLR
jgi:hypothetical protein